MFETKYISNPQRTVLLKEESTWSVFDPIKREWKIGVTYFLRAIRGDFEYEYISEEEMEHVKKQILA